MTNLNILYKIAKQRVKNIFLKAPKQLTVTESQLKTNQLINWLYQTICCY